MKEEAKKIEAFVERWTGKGDEKGQSQMFWIELLQDVLGVETPSEVISFENRVKLSHTSFIDAYIRSTKVLIEQKSIDKNLRDKIKQSDGMVLSPFQQAKRYSMELPYSLRPRWVVTCNFRSFLIYDMEHPQSDPFELLLENLPKESHKLAFLVDNTQDHIRREMEISVQAGALVGRLYDAFLGQYHDPTSAQTLHDLNVLCVRLVFCLFAEDSGLFYGNHQAFYQYMRQYQPQQMRKALIELFDVLNTDLPYRDPYLEEPLSKFPYVSGGLFAEKGIEIPQLTSELADILLEEGSEGIDWSGISPTIFGAVFESTLNPDTRRSGGMHYTSVENIHKVIDPLFMNELNDRFDEARYEPNEKKKCAKLRELQTDIAQLTFFDPACGSGNFLTETFISLRRLENRILTELNKQQAIMDFENPIKVKISQFYGIEINDFAVTVAQTALWIAESQMMQETQTIVMSQLDFLPLRNYAHIHHGNALRTPWEEIVEKDRLSYIIGNPPFVGKSFQTTSQKEDMAYVMSCIKNYGNLDYVTCWYKKAADIMMGTKCEAAFVSTNSICQGIAVPPLWRYMQECGMTINFAWQTFKWESESSQKAAVHCVIIGFSYQSHNSKKIYSEGGNTKVCNNINAYLLNAPNIIIDDIHDPISDVPKTAVGSFPTDGGNLVISADEYDNFIKNEPKTKEFIKPFIGPLEFINNKKRYCLWLKGCSPAVIRSMPSVLARIKKVSEFRLSSKKVQTQKRAEYPHLFAEDRQPNTNYILFPRTSSSSRRYIPIGFMDSGTIAGDTIILPNANIYHFGILTSNVHQSWMRLLCGRMKSDYRYSGTLVYNTFPWPTPTDEQRARIEQSAQAILDARALYPDSSLADLYDEVTMPIELRRAHQQNDRAVMQAYGFSVKDYTESDCVAALLKMYKELTK